MHDINWIRNDPELFDQALSRRKVNPFSEELLKIDELRRKEITLLQRLQHERNDKSKAIGLIKDKSGSEFIKAKEEVELVNSEIEKLKIVIDEYEKKLNSILECLPNVLSADVPDGEDENDSVEVSKWGEPRKFTFQPKHHFEIGEDLRMMDFEQTALISGSRFVTLKGDLAKMERALANFMLDIHTHEYGYMEISPPVLVKDQAMYGVGQLPKFAEDSFQTTNGYRLIPTSEVPLTNLVAEKIISQSELPMRFTAFSNCFRSEAGSAGKDTRGMIRMHQFSKVELVCISDKESYYAEYENMINAAGEILRRLELPHRRVVLCAVDTGFSAEKTFDFEVWLPGQNKYREISSCSIFGQFQGRRMKAKYRDEHKETHYVYTMNGSGLAIGRTIVAILENNQNEDGSIDVPHALRPYMNGQTKIQKL
jgi:seryl-tRNA synthetase